MPFIKEEVSPEEIRQCLGAISRNPKGASEIRLPPGEVYGHTSPDGRYIYINFVKPSETPIGSVYRTWIVRLRGASRRAFRTIGHGGGRPGMTITACRSDYDIRSS